MLAPRAGCGIRITLPNSSFGKTSWRRPFRSTVMNWPGGGPNEAMTSSRKGSDRDANHSR